MLAHLDAVLLHSSLFNSSNCQACSADIHMYNAGFNWTPGDVQWFGNLFVSIPWFIPLNNFPQICFEWSFVFRTINQWLDLPYCCYSLWHFELPATYLSCCWCRGLSPVWCWCLLFASLMQSFSLALVVMHLSLAPDWKAAFLALKRALTSLFLWSPPHQHICWYLMSLKMYIRKDWCCCHECSIQCNSLFWDVRS